MAILADGDRAALWAKWMRDNSATISITKADLRAAVNALDDFMNTNAAAINLAIPQPARSSLTTAQKAMLLNYVVSTRYIKGA